MKINVFVFLLLTSVYTVLAQQSAVTENGEEVILYKNGSWTYKDGRLPAKVIPTNSEKFMKDSGSKHLLRSSNINIGIWINKDRWSFKKATNKPNAEFELRLKGENLSGIFITDSTTTPFEAMKTMALEKAWASNLTVVKEEIRTVNNVKVLFLQMIGDSHGMKFIYRGYYFSNENGTVQFIVYTGQSVFDKYYSESQKLLNGLVELEEKFQATAPK